MILRSKEKSRRSRVSGHGGNISKRVGVLKSSQAYLFEMVPLNEKLKGSKKEGTYGKVRRRVSTGGTVGNELKKRKYGRSET